MPVNTLRRSWIFIFSLFLATILFSWGCTPRTYLIVDYQVPPGSRQLAGQQVRLEVRDLRADPYVLEPAAARQFKGFKDIYSLAWVTADKKRTLAGEYDLLSLFRVTFQKRLEALGVTVVSDDRQQAPVFQVDLHHLKIDQKERNWVAQMSYTASLTKDNQLIAREMVKGSAERVKIIGRKGADNTLSDIFSDIINRLNILNLFSQAQLI